MMIAYRPPMRRSCELVSNFHRIDVPLMKLPAKPKTWTEAERRQLTKLVREGARTLEISAKLGRYARSVKQMARAMGLLLRK